MELFNEEFLREAIQEKWGPTGAHMDVYINLLRRARMLEQREGRLPHEFEALSTAEKLQVITDGMKTKLDQHIHKLRMKSNSSEAIRNYYFSIINIYSNRAHNVFMGTPLEFQESGIAALKMASLAKQIVGTGFFQFRKRYLLEKEIRKISKKHNIKYP